MKSNKMTFATIGEIFDDATTRLVGGVDDQQRGHILSDLTKVQDGLEQLLQQHPEQFQGVAAIHAQNIVDQLNLEIGAVKSADPFAAKYINDVQRDLIDIVQGDPALAALANQGGHHGFQAVPSLLVPPAQFVGNAEQTQFMKDFISTTQSFADRAQALVGPNADPAAVAALVGEIQTYEQTANAFTIAQGGVYSARFNNEFAADGVNGTASRAMIDGLMKGDAQKVASAAEVMTANAQDVAGNMLGIGVDPPPSTGNGIPDHITTVAEAGTVFNDATTKLIGGVYAGNRQSIHDDLTATRQGLQDMLDQGQFSGHTQARVAKIVGLLGSELAIVDNPNAPANSATVLHKLHTEVIALVQTSRTLSAAAVQDDATGFMQLPDAPHVHPGAGSGGDHHVAASSPHPNDPMAHIFAAGDHPIA